MSGAADPAPIVALLPMRHHSARVPGKNYRLLAGRPLYEYILETLLNVRGIGLVVVDTDSPRIQESIARSHPQVRLLERPVSLRDDRVAMNDVIAYDLSQVPGEVFLQSHSTNPLLTRPTIERALDAFRAALPEKDSLFSVTRLHSRLWDEAGRPLNHDPSRLLRTQDLPPVFEENSCLYVFDRKTFESRRNRIGARPLLFEIEAEEAWDIDNEVDFGICEGLIAQRREAPDSRREGARQGEAPGTPSREMPTRSSGT